MRLLVSWMRDFVDGDASPSDIAETLGLRGFEVASVEAVGNGDAVIDFEVTANRPDCLSVIGLAREVATAYDRPITLPSASPGAKLPLKPSPAGVSDRLTVSIEDSDLCPRYAAAVADVSVRPSPAWMAARRITSCRHQKRPRHLRPCPLPRPVSITATLPPWPCSWIDPCPVLPP